MSDVPAPRTQGPAEAASVDPERLRARDRFLRELAQARVLVRGSAAAVDPADRVRWRRRLQHESPLPRRRTGAA